MKYAAITRLGCLIFLGILAFNANAEGLSEYLQNPEVTKVAANTLSMTPETITSNAGITSETLPKDSAQLKNIIELVVAGIVASALIIVILVIFLGRWLAGREKKLIKELRIEAEENTDHITSAATTIREQEKETTQITQNMRGQAADLSTQKQETEKLSKEVFETSKHVKEYEKDINTVSTNVKDNMSKIQKYWDTQVNETVDTISLFQHKLSENIDNASKGLDKINEQKTISGELLQDFLSKHNEQNLLIDNNTEVSEKVSSNLAKAYKESNKLLDLIKKQQEQAELSLNEYSERLNNFEEQAYEQFDTSFQVADLARQELSANLDENRKHIETMRRQEEQSHGINTQISKNLETLDYSKILKISETLDNTQDMFDEIHTKVETTRVMLEELKQIEEDIKQTANNVENVTKSHSILEEHEIEVDQQIDELIEAAEDALETPNLLDEKKGLADDIIDALDTPTEKIRGNTTVAITDYKMASGDSSTPLSFFRDIQKNSHKK